MQLHKGIEDFKAGKANDKDAKILADKSVAPPTPLAKDPPSGTKRAVSQRSRVGIGNRRAAEAGGDAASGGGDRGGGGRDSEESDKSQVQKMDDEMVQEEDGSPEEHSDDGGRCDISPDGMRSKRIHREHSKAKKDRGKQGKSSSVSKRRGCNVSQAKRKLCLAAGPVSKKVLNQGGHGTCVGYAFSRVMTGCLCEKYGVTCDPEKFVEKVKALCPCWEGHEPESMLEEWNEQHDKPGAAIEDVDQRLRYNVVVKYTKITSYQAAHAEMKRQEALKMLMLCTISTDKEGHDLHAVALHGTVPGGTMEAVNSWGARQPLLEVTPQNFLYAIRFDPNITAATKSGGRPQAIPPVRKGFTKRMQEARKAEEEEVNCALISK